MSLRLDFGFWITLLSALLVFAEARWHLFCYTNPGVSFGFKRQTTLLLPPDTSTILRAWQWCIIRTSIINTSFWLHLFYFALGALLLLCLKPRDYCITYSSLNKQNMTDRTFKLDLLNTAQDSDATEVCVVLLITEHCCVIRRRENRR